VTRQSISVNLKVGSWVTVFDETDVDEDEKGLAGFTGSPVFEDKVVQYVPETAKLRFAESDMGYADFTELLEQHDSVQVIRP